MAKTLLLVTLLWHDYHTTHILHRRLSCLRGSWPFKFAREWFTIQNHFFLRQWILCWNNIINLTERNDLYFVNVICTQNHCRFPPIPFNSHVYAEVLCSRRHQYPVSVGTSAIFSMGMSPVLSDLAVTSHFFLLFSEKDHIAYWKSSPWTLFSTGNLVEPGLNVDCANGQKGWSL